MPGHGNAHRIETDCGDAAKIIFGDKGLEMMAQALAIHRRTQRALQLKRVGGTRRRKE